MKSKETIRNEIIHYANIVWGTKTIHQLDPLVRLMIEELCNELYLLHHKLNETDQTLIKKLAKNLSPSLYDYIRPGHAVLRIKPDVPLYHLTRTAAFFLKNSPSEIRYKDFNSIVFTPVTDIKLTDVSISHLFFNKTLWTVDNTGNKTVLTQTEKRAKYNTLWLGLEIGKGVEYLNELPFFIDFPHLNDTHSYYDILSSIRWSLNGMPLSVKYGLPLLGITPPSDIEQDILLFYKDHYQSVTDPRQLTEIAQQSLPEELAIMIDKELATALVPRPWLCLSFPPNFSSEDIEKILILVNAFPVLNRHYKHHSVSKEEYYDVISLSSDSKEEFLEIDTLQDSSYTTYSRQDTLTQTGTYTVEPVRKKKSDDTEISDYLERMADMIRNEKIAFPEIDNEQVVKVLNSIHEIQNKKTHRIELNRLNHYEEIARLTINPVADITSIDISYWTTLAQATNGIPEKTALMVHKIPELNKSDAIFITPVRGGKSFYNTESLKAIHRFYLTAKDRILTKNNIINFCKIELGDYAESIDAERKVTISPKFKEGLINSIEIKITPLEQYIHYFEQKGVLKNLIIRLKKRSPENFNYKIKIINRTGNDLKMPNE